LGARIGIKFEGTLRSIVQGFLKENGIKSGHVTRKAVLDKEGYVYGYPSEVEVDVFVSEPFIIGEAKSIIEDKGIVFDFQKKIELFEKLYSKKTWKKFIACLDVDERKKEDVYRIAKKFGIKILVDL
jgi:hypothetical protein